MLEIDLLGCERVEALAPAQVQRLCRLALASAGVGDGHLAIEFVSPERIAHLNERHRGKQGPTDVLSFPIDGPEPCGGPPGGGPGGALLGDSAGGGPGDGPPCELGDVVICPEHTEDVEEAVIHGVLHLLGMDHETDEGQMLALQSEILRWGRG